MGSLKEFDAPEKCYDYIWDSDILNEFLESEGCEHITDKWEDSYGLERHTNLAQNEDICRDYWYWAKLMNGYIFRIYVFNGCIIVDRDWDFGGNAGSSCYWFDRHFLDIWDNVINDIKDYIKYTLD